MNDQLTVLTPVNLDGTPSDRRMNKYISADGTPIFDARHKFYSVAKRKFSRLYDFFEEMEALTKGTQETIIRGLYWTCHGIVPLL